MTVGDGVSCGGEGAATGAGGGEGSEWFVFKAGTLGISCTPLLLPNQPKPPPFLLEALDSALRLRLLPEDCDVAVDERLVASSSLAFLFLRAPTVSACCGGTSKVGNILAAMWLASGGQVDGFQAWLARAAVFSINIYKSTQERTRGLHMRRTHERKHTDHIIANTAPERLTLYSRTLVRPRWLALIRLASRSKDSRTILKGFDGAAV